MSLSSLAKVLEMEDLTTCEFTLLAHIASSGSETEDGWIDSDWRAISKQTGFTIAQINRMLTGLVCAGVISQAGVLLMPPIGESNYLKLYMGVPEQRQISPAEEAPSTKPGYIYLMYGVGTEWYKIGYSTRPVERTAQVASKNPFDVTLLHSFYVDDVIAVERSLHAHLADKRVSGEWYALTSEDVDWLRSLTDAP